jgi:hypothetical protein
MIHTNHTILTKQRSQGYTIGANMRFSMTKLAKRRMRGVGELVLLSYLACVIGIAIMQRVTGWPTVADLASSPALIIDGQWWRIITSGLVIQGPAVPQIIAIAVLGSLGIYIGGSWVFWRSAVAGHVVATLVAYAGFSAVWLLDRTLSTRFLTDPDYGVSLIWCAALGAFAALSWLGPRANWRRPHQPIPALLAVIVIVVVAAYSDPMAGVQHAIAFIVGLCIIATADQSKIVHKQRRPLGSQLAKQ